MVLDDLGLVPTLRRTAAERSRRSGLGGRLRVRGADARLGKELESAMFRIVDDSMTASLEAKPAELVVILDWQESGVTATVRGRPVGAPVAGPTRALWPLAAARRDKQMPAGAGVDDPRTGNGGQARLSREGMGRDPGPRPVRSALSATFRPTAGLSRLGRRLAADARPEHNPRSAT
jgi:hypothetical protein